MKIHILDLNFQGIEKTIASYLVEGPAGVALIETGPMTTLDTLLQRLAEHGLTPDDVRDVLVTHIHLDHAGAAGWWAQQGAQVYVHPVGAPHLVDPSKLWRSAGRIYGDDMERLWGEILPAPAGSVTEVRDGDAIAVAGLTFTALDTPGHAWHHHTYRLETEDGPIAFTGDAAGVCIPDGNLISLPAPPPEFDMEAWHKTLDRLEEEAFTTLYPTHYGPVVDAQAHLTALRALMVESAEFIKDGMDAGKTRDQLVHEYLAWNRQRAAAKGLSPTQFDQYEAANPLFMSVDGLIRYWRKRAEKEAA